MSKFGDYWAAQCGNPRGIVGKIMTWAMNRANNVMYHGIIDNMKLSKNMRILDVGFGNGYLEKLIYKEVQCSIYGIDISEDMVKVASKNNKKGIANGDIALLVGDCCELIFENNSFDVVTTMNTIYFWKDTYVNNENEGKPSIFVKIIEKFGAGFKYQFDYNTYKDLFVKAGYSSVEYKLVRGKIPCAIAVITKL